MRCRWMSTVNLARRPAQAAGGEPHSLLEQTTTVDSRSNEQTQLRQTLEQGFAKMATCLSTAIENAFKNSSYKFDDDPIKDELLTELEEGELESNGNANASNGKNGRQNDRQSREKPDVSDGTNVQRMIERAKVQILLNRLKSLVCLMAYVEK